MNCQKKLFQLDPEIHYLNCAFKAPLLTSVEEACIEGLQKKRNPFRISENDFFEQAEETKKKFARLINCDSHNVAINASTSYGFSTALNNIKAKKGGNAVCLGKEFPSGYFSIKKWCTKNQNELKIVHPNPDEVQKGKSWNEKLLAAINEQTSVVLISSIHWMNGIKFDLEAIGKQCKKVGALFIVDGTQSVGALPIDVKAFQIDALISATYKTLFGPYSTTLSYFSDYFNDGEPLEEAWINRTNAADFNSLTDYDDNYTSKAGRYNVGELGSFILMPMLNTALGQIEQWNPASIQHYCATLNAPLKKFLHSIGVILEEKTYFSNHLFSLELPKQIDQNKFKEELLKNNIYVSVRDGNIRISLNVFNNHQDIDALIEVIKKFL